VVLSGEALIVKYRILGRTGLRVSAIGLGAGPFGIVNRAADWDPWSEEGRRTAIATVHRALERGINYVDTAPGYGDGHSEDILGEALANRRDRVILATKCPWRDAEPASVRESVHASLRRLRTDYLDVVQLHGGTFEIDVARTLEVLTPELERLRDEGKTRFIGFTTEEPWPARPLIASGRFDLAQLRYSLIYQEPAMHALPEASAAGLGVAVMRPLTSGVLQREVRALEPSRSIEKVYELTLKFVLADSRVHVANVGMRWPHEVDRNVDLAESFEPQIDIAGVPRLTVDLYRAEDDEAARASG
jgi:aryl-alcohol dehydrogenase-like predicted oxidoreductase